MKRRRKTIGYCGNDQQTGLDNLFRENRSFVTQSLIYPIFMPFYWVDEVGMSIRAHLSDFVQRFFADKCSYIQKACGNQRLRNKNRCSNFLFKIVYLLFPTVLQ